MPKLRFIWDVPAVKVRVALAASVVPKVGDPDEVIVDDPKSITRVFELLEVILPQVRL